LAAQGVLQFPSKDRETTFSLPAFLDAISDKDLGYELKKKRVSSIAEALKEARYLQTISELHRKQGSHGSKWKSETSDSDSDVAELKIRRDMEDYDELGKASRVVSTSADSSSSERCSGLGEALLRSSDSESVSGGGSIGSYRRARRRRNRPQRDARGLNMTFWNTDYQRRRKDSGDGHGNGQPNVQQSERWNCSDEEFSEGCRSRDSRSSFWARH
jgi:hypothetical protein